jgi:hypothetical protein
MYPSEEQRVAKPIDLAARDRGLTYLYKKNSSQFLVVVDGGDKPRHDGQSCEHRRSVAAEPL